MKTLLFDAEANNLMPLADTIWIICGKIKGSSEVASFRERDPFLQWIEEEKPDQIVNHGLLSYDLPLIGKLWNVPYKVGKDSHFNRVPTRLIDTLLLSQFLNPDREGGHSLQNFGDIIGCPKMDYRQHLVDIGVMKSVNNTEDEPKGFEFTFWHPSMEVYCSQDIETNSSAFDYLLKEVERY